MPKSPTFLRGHLLLDGGSLQGSFFHRSVVLICQHDEEGAFGLVLNRPAAAKVGDALVADLPDSLKELSLFVGGPVQPGALSYLHSDDFLPGAKVLQNLDYGHSLDDLSDIGSSLSAGKKLRLFAGYAGWSPGQLEDEMKRKAWLTHPASIELVFDRDPASLWRNILLAKGGYYRMLASMPDDLSVN
jgi:putative transcriptional regulator